MVHLVISCLRLVAFMYNRQQKWLFERKLPDLTFLRRLLRLDLERTGKQLSCTVDARLPVSLPMQVMFAVSGS